MEVQNDTEAGKEGQQGQLTSDSKHRKQGQLSCPERQEQGQIASFAAAAKEAMVEA